MIPLILVHAGLGSSLEPKSGQAVRSLIEEGSRSLRDGVPALEVSWRLVERLEESGLFNAGFGAIPQEDGIIRRDIGTMEGATLKCLGIPGIVNVSCPSRILPVLFRNTKHVLLSGESVSRWTRSRGLSDLPFDPAFPEESLSYWNETKEGTGTGTVGAVVRDPEGRYAATTSTGGAGKMRPGRIGDSAIPGAGYYADDRIGAISMTGEGESILRAVAGYRLLSLSDSAPSREHAAKEGPLFLKEILGRTGGRIGGILVSRRNGPFVFHSPGPMLAGVWSAREEFIEISDTWDKVRSRVLETSF
jgi:beta-aspartyl-peptidase (threonine type)